MPRDQIGNEIMVGAIVRMPCQVMKIDEHDDDPDADLHLRVVGPGLVPIADLPNLEVHASSVVCESGPPEGWVPPEGDVGEESTEGGEWPGGARRGVLLPSAGDANDPFGVREEHQKIAAKLARKRERQGQESAQAQQSKPEDQPPPEGQTPPPPPSEGQPPPPAEGQTDPNQPPPMEVPPKVEGPAEGEPKPGGFGRGRRH